MGKTVGEGLHTSLTNKNKKLKNSILFSKSEFTKLLEENSKLLFEYDAIKQEFQNYKEKMLVKECEMNASPDFKLLEKCHNLEKTILDLEKANQDLEIQKTNEWLRANARQMDVDILNKKLQEASPKTNEFERKVSDLNHKCFLKGVEIEKLQKEIEEHKKNILFYQEKLYKVEQNPLLDFTAYFNKSKIDRSEFLYGLGFENITPLQKAKNEVEPLYDERFLRLGMVPQYVRSSDEEFETDDVEKVKSNKFLVNYDKINTSYETK